MALPFVSEEAIEEVLDSFSNPEVMESAMNDLITNQSNVFAFLQQESMDILTKDEKQLLLVLVTTMFEACKKVVEVPMVPEKHLGAAEEKNWSLLMETKKKQFRHRLDIFFEQSIQEDILAFFEDSLIEEDGDITDIGREPVFVAAVSCLQALEATLSE